MSKRIVFKCLFGGKHGWGHLVRCTAIAQFAKERSWKTILWTDCDTAELACEMEEAFDEILPFRGVGRMEEDLGNFDALLIDEMYTEEVVFDRFRESIDRLDYASTPVFAAIDDMNLRSLSSVDLVVNSELGLESSPYNARKKQLVGERFCPLRKGFLDTRKPMIEIQDSEMPIFVMIGGTDPFGLSVQVLHELSTISAKLVPVLVTGEHCDGESDIARAMERFTRSKWLKRVDSATIASWLSICRLGVIGCGSSVFELAAMKIPFVGISLVDNQKNLSIEVSEKWGLPVISCESGISRPLGVAEQVKGVLAKPDASLSAFKTAVDAYGCDRILDGLEACM